LNHCPKNGRETDETETIMLSEKSQSQQIEYHIFLLICETRPKTMTIGIINKKGLIWGGSRRGGGGKASILQGEED
jgi:hypothetical protein